MLQDRVVGFFYLKIFLLLILLFVVGSIVVKISSEILESTFRNNTFSLLYVAHDTKVIFVDKAQKSVMYLSIGDVRNIVKGKSPFEASIALGIPVNAIVFDSDAPQNIEQFISSKNVLRLLFAADKPVLKNLDKYDIYKLTNAMRDSVKDNRREIRLNIFDQNEMKKKVGDGFKDSLINNQQYTVEIDNGTSVDGLGNELAIILGREGYNVISVRTSSGASNSYIAYPGSPNDFTSSLVGLTGFSLINAKKSFSADVTIFLGEDVDAMLSL